MVKKDESDPREAKAENTKQNKNGQSHFYTQDIKEKKHLLTKHKHKPCKDFGMRSRWKIIIMDEYLLCNALNRDISPPSSLPTALICLLMAWQISLPAAIWAFSPSKPPRVARSIKETQRREYTASTCVCVARGWDTRSKTCDRNVAKLRSSHWPPSVVTNTT